LARSWWGSSYIDEAQLAFALGTLPAGLRLGEYFGEAWCVLAEEDLYESAQLAAEFASGPFGAAHGVKRNVARSLPLQIMREWKVVPVSHFGRQVCFLQVRKIPTDELSKCIARFHKT